MSKRGGSGAERRKRKPRALPPIPYPAPDGMAWTRDAKGVPTLRLKTMSEHLSRKPR